MIKKRRAILRVLPPDVARLAWWRLGLRNWSRALFWLGVVTSARACSVARHTRWSEGARYPDSGWVCCRRAGRRTTASLPKYQKTRTSLGRKRTGCVIQCAPDRLNVLGHEACECHRAVTEAMLSRPAPNRWSAQARSVHSLSSCRRSARVPRSVAVYASMSRRSFRAMTSASASRSSMVTVRSCLT